MIIGLCLINGGSSEKKCKLDRGFYGARLTTYTTGLEEAFGIQRYEMNGPVF